MKVYIATMDTTNFSFTAVDTTEEKARKALMRGWHRHKERTGATLTDKEVKDDINVEGAEMGECWMR